MTARAKARRPRKPKPIFDSCITIDESKYGDLVYLASNPIWLNGFNISTKDARKIAAWLLKAADYLEGK